MTSEGVDGKVVLILGGGGGIGSETARMLAARGARTAVADIDSRRARAVAAAIDPLGDRARGYRVDVRDKSQARSVVAAVLEDFGRLDVLVNSAGTMLIRPLCEIDTEEWETTIDLNVKGTLWGIAAALPVFLRQSSGHFVTLGSVHGLSIFAGGTVHSASKFAVRTIAEGLRQELADVPIRVTTVSPGAVNTGMEHRTTGTASARVREIYRKAIAPSAVARAIVYAVEQPDDVAVNEIVIRPTAQRF
jgi:NADP-dependent 3-hydroxy acid dehydrogenase YdfG